MTAYQEAIDYLCRQMPMFQQIGSGAYKAGMDTSLRLDEHFGHPHRQFHTVHIAGTNGKGSTAHTIAAIFQAAGYNTGLYTSPHLTDFRERIRVNGVPIRKEYVINFLNNNRDFYEPLKPSFFELTTSMAFCYFRDRKVDIAIIETGLGGRLDCTNVITPDLSVITNIGYDHISILGDTLGKIAYEKAGIIKREVPVVIGEDCNESRPVFAAKAAECNSRIVFAKDKCKILSSYKDSSGKLFYDADGYRNLESELQGFCQVRNANTILHAVSELGKAGWNLPESAVREGFRNVCGLTGLRGRWQKLQNSPTIVCDTGHNSHGLHYIAEQLDSISAADGAGTLRIVFGMVNDKDTGTVLKLMPKNAVWYFTQAGVSRAIPSDELQRMAGEAGLYGKTYHSVSDAVRTAVRESSPNDFIFVGGSTFVVADLLSMSEFQ